MTPNHSTQSIGIIRFTTPCGRKFVAYGDPKTHADAVKHMIEEMVK